jgi:hypothetical protein
MSGFPLTFINRVRSEACRGHDQAVVESGGRSYRFAPYDLGPDTFVLEEGIWQELPPRAPVLIVPKEHLLPGAGGFLMTVSSGNHALAAVPLLQGRLWAPADVAPERRSDLLRRGVVCGNVVDERLELSQREVPTELVVRVDAWLRGLGWPLAEVIVADREDATLEHYRRQGQEWRVKPLAWTREEMDLALRAGRARIHSVLRYYHSVKGVHLLSYAEFARLGALAGKDFPAFSAALDELVGTADGGRVALMRSPRFRGHHEIELFGVHGTQAIDLLVPALERLREDLRSGACTPAASAGRFAAIQAAFLRALENPALADENSEVFVGSMYKHLTGEVYYGSRQQLAPAFDDRRTALPGATFHDGKAEIHPGADERTLAILDFVQRSLSHGEVLEYANVYELRLDDTVPLGSGPTREVIYKTNRRPVCMQLLEKRLAHQGAGYGAYMLARVQAFQSLGVAYGGCHLLARRDRQAGETHYYIRERYPGFAFGAIPPSLLTLGEKGSPGDTANPEALLAVAALMGNAAAQNLAVKKYLPAPASVQFGEGKEIIEFGYDVQRMREMPLRVRLCSVRGTLGWPDTACDEANLRRCFDFYMTSFARTMARFQREHARVIGLRETGERFLDGFAASTRELHWNYTSRQEQFAQFDPALPAAFDFRPKWLFALWALEQQQRRLPELRRLFMRRLANQAAEEAAPAGAA